MEQLSEPKPKEPDVIFTCRACGHEREYPVVHKGEAAALYGITRDMACVACGTVDWVDVNASRMR
mgnify:CR=1 FL=1